ncbi:MAG TPA: LON peptidase substrate-binding domain-containing protein [Terriglobia bacterium]|nr:LON peptidase substrate-binding domain-containing protein [Terriglobia bacterium]
MEELLLPLFPLDMVLVPEEPLPLHIFEERYKRMIGDCLKAKAEESGQQEFGIVFAKGEEMQPVGCGARIVNVTRKYVDGRLDIFTVGTRRFEILVTHQEDETTPYPRAAVTFFDDDEGHDTPAEPDAGHAIDLFRQIMQKLHKAAEMPIHLPKPYRYLSFRIAAALPLDLDFKQELLSVRDESDRLHQVTDAIEALIPQIDMVQKTRNKAGGNGNARIQS